MIATSRPVPISVSAGHALRPRARISSSVVRHMGTAPPSTRVPAGRLNSAPVRAGGFADGSDGFLYSTAKVSPLGAPGACVVKPMSSSARASACAAAGAAPATPATAEAVMTATAGSFLLR